MACGASHRSQEGGSRCIALPAIYGDRCPVPAFGPSPLPLPPLRRPAIFDIAAASVYIALSLQPWIAVIVFVTLRWDTAPSVVAVFVCDPQVRTTGSEWQPNRRGQGRKGMALLRWPFSWRTASPTALNSQCSFYPAALYIPMTVYLTESVRSKYTNSNKRIVFNPLSPAAATSP